MVCRLVRRFVHRLTAAKQSDPPFPMPPVVLTPPGAGGVRITEDGLIGNWYPGVGQERRATLLLLGGSEGGLGPAAAQQAMDFVKHGFAVLQLAYFGVPGLPLALVMIPLEYFDNALAWLVRQPTVDAARMGVVGGSKGAEAALLVAARNPDVRAVVVGSASAAVWPGMDYVRNDRVQSSWSADGVPLPYLPYGGTATTMLEAYEKGLEQLPAHPEAAIPVDRIRGRVLLVCGRNDTLWPSCAMSEIVARTMGQRSSVLAYDDAGHAVFGPPVSPAAPDFALLGAFGGSPAGNETAREDAWPRVRHFLLQELAIR